MFHVTDDAYESMEMLVRRVFDKDNIGNINPETKRKLSNIILHDEDITFT